MSIFTVQRVDKYDYDFSVSTINHDAFIDKAKAIKRARQVYESMCAEYEDEMKRYSDEDVYEEVSEGLLYLEEDDENGYYFISFGREEDHETHCVCVEEFDLVL